MHVQVVYGKNLTFHALERGWWGTLCISRAMQGYSQLLWYRPGLPCIGKGVACIEPILVLKQWVPL